MGGNGKDWSVKRKEESDIVIILLRYIPNKRQWVLMVMP